VGVATVLDLLLGCNNDTNYDNNIVDGVGAEIWEEEKKTSLLGLCGPEQSHAGTRARRELKGDA
jgi:hypothetical protein